MINHRNPTSKEHALRTQALRRLIELLAERVARRLLEDAAANKSSSAPPQRHTN
jgi:hypothetical protein